ncbi:hypothetical protein [Singulisphaera sp. GP187]|uniref:hypothetical protein n=1 Tax=Singulisphaera sp. GP187 TaxID=1882752 RepID=UPI0020B161C6|nr:hypothetical protein [Singulisphaera sp. GP187]
MEKVRIERAVNLIFEDQSCAIQAHENDKEADRQGDPAMHDQEDFANDRDLPENNNARLIN